MLSQRFGVGLLVKAFQMSDQVPGGLRVSIQRAHVLLKPLSDPVSNPERGVYDFSGVQARFDGKLAPCPGINESWHLSLADGHGEIDVVPGVLPSRHSIIERRELHLISIAQDRVVLRMRIGVPDVGVES